MVESTSDSSVQAHILQLLDKNSTIEDTLQLAQQLGIPHIELDKSLKSLSAEEYITL
jgi:hypothetical protein